MCPYVYTPISMIVPQTRMCQSCTHMLLIREIYLRLILLTTIFDRSLHILICYFFSGDGKSAPNPLFRVKVILEGDKVEFSPTLKQLALIVGSIASHLTDAIGGVRRLPDILTKKRSNKEVRHTVEWYKNILPLCTHHISFMTDPKLSD